MDPNQPQDVSNSDNNNSQSFEPPVAGDLSTQVNDSNLNLPEVSSPGVTGAPSEPIGNPTGEMTGSNPPENSEFSQTQVAGINTGIPNMSSTTSPADPAPTLSAQSDPSLSSQPSNPVQPPSTMSDSSGPVPMPPTTPSQNVGMMQPPNDQTSTKPKANKFVVIIVVVVVLVAIVSAILLF